MLENTKPDVRFAFILSQEFTLTPFAGFIDAVRHAADERDHSRQIYCNWTCIGPDMEPVRSSCGLEMPPWKKFDAPENYDYIVVVGGRLAFLNQRSEEIIEYLQTAAKKKIPLIGLCTGGFLLAEAGLMSGHRCAVHIDHADALRTAYPDVLPVTNEMYVFDDGRITCPGGTAAIDLAVDILSRHCGQSRGMKALTALVVDEHRKSHSVGRMPFQDLEFCGEQKVEDAVKYMRQSLSEQISFDQLASKLNTSRRQLDRLFTDKVGKTPVRLWREMRLEHSRWRLINTSRSITEIAYECGFSDSAHFVRTYKQFYGETPSRYRDSRRRHAFP
ncbi:MAG: GlxA family transcriptional regulator [Rhodobacteraceae bacterium]|nr:GlxA family transcriptional regulator [Paracoccaceae bacterium]